MSLSLGLISGSAWRHIPEDWGILKRDRFIFSMTIPAAAVTIMRGSAGESCANNLSALVENIVFVALFAFMWISLTCIASEHAINKNLVQAASSGRLESVRALIATGVIHWQREARAALLAALENGHLAIAEELLYSGTAEGLILPEHARQLLATSPS